MGSLKKIIEGVFSKAIYDLSKYLFVIFITGISGVAAHIYASNIEYLIPYAVIISISCAALIGMLGLNLYKKNNPIYKIYTKTDFKYLILSKECIYEYKDLNHMIYEKHFKIKVLCKSLDRFYDKYNWTGCSDPNIISDDNYHKIIFTTKRDAFQQYEVYFGKIYKKGDIIDLHITFELEDFENKVVPVLSSTVVEPTKYLKLKVKIPKEYIKDKACAEIFPVIDSRIALDKKDINFNNYGVIEWEIPEPEMLLVYSLTWDMIR